MLRTTSQIISYYIQMEEENSENYRKTSQYFPDQRALFTNIAKESLKHRDRVLRTYRQGVTDAFEVGFNPNPIDPDHFKVSKIPDTTLAETLEASIKNEETIIKFCETATKSSGELLPDLPDTFEYIIRKKKQRIEKLSSARS